MFLLQYYSIFFSFFFYFIKTSLFSPCSLESFWVPDLFCLLLVTAEQFGAIHWIWYPESMRATCSGWLGMGVCVIRARFAICVCPSAATLHATKRHACWFASIRHSDIEENLSYKNGGAHACDRAEAATARDTRTPHASSTTASQYWNRTVKQS